MYFSSDPHQGSSTAYCSHHHWGISSTGDGGIHPYQNFAQGHLGKAFLGYFPLALSSCQHTEEEAHRACLLRSPGETHGRSLLSTRTLSKTILPLNGSFFPAQILHLDSHCKSFAPKCKKKHPIPIFFSPLWPKEDVRLFGWDATYNFCKKHICYHGCVFCHLLINVTAQQQTT